MNILICAAIGSKNLWDELILKNEIVILEKEYAERFLVEKNDFKFNVFSYSHKDPFFTKKNVLYKPYFPSGMRSISWFFVNIKNFFVFLSQIRKADIVVFGWGGIIYDREHQSVGNPLRQWEFRALICRLLKKRVDFFRVWLSVQDPDNYASVESIFSGAEYISVRDNYSFELLKKLGFEKNLILEEDPVFSDKRTNLLLKSGSWRTLSRYLASEAKGSSFLWAFDSKNFDLLDLKETTFTSWTAIKGKNIWISFRQLDSKWYEQNIMKLLEWIIEEKWKLYFIPHSFHETDTKANDYMWLLKIKNNLERKYPWLQIAISMTMEESYEMYTQQKIDLNFAQRLHSIILSSVYEIPFIWMSYWTKTKELLGEFRKS